MSASPASRDVRSPFRTNQYPATCCHCNGRIAAKAGSLMGRATTGRWRVSHDACVPEHLWVSAAEGAQSAFDDPQQ